MATKQDTISKYMADIGRKGGESKSEIKSRASRLNGKKHRKRIISDDSDNSDPGNLIDGAEIQNSDR